MAKQRFRSMTGGAYTIVFPDQQVQVATPTGMATKFLSRGRVTLQPEGTVVNRDHAELLKDHPFYGDAFISEEDIQKRLAAAGAANPKQAKEDELRARIAELEAQLSDGSKAEQPDNPKPSEPAEEPANEPEAETDEPPAEAENATEAPDEADESEDLKEITSAKTLNGAISYLARYHDATPDAIKAAGGPVEYAAELGIVFPNLDQ